MRQVQGRKVGGDNLDRTVGAQALLPRIHRLRVQFARGEERHSVEELAFRIRRDNPGCDGERTGLAVSVCSVRMTNGSGREYRKAKVTVTAPADPQGDRMAVRLAMLQRAYDQAIQQ